MFLKSKKTKFILLLIVLALFITACDIGSSSFEDDPVVYVTRTGERYHRSNCQYLSQSRIAMSLGSAQSEGYTPCSVCTPPR